MRAPTDRQTDRQTDSPTLQPIKVRQTEPDVESWPTNDKTNYNYGSNICQLSLFVFVFTLYFSLNV